MASKEDTTKTEKSVSESLASSLQEELDASRKRNFVYHFGFIYKVSEKYRNLKEDSYTPRVVSIGPLHHGKSHLQAMEGCKLRCLNQLLDTFKMDLMRLSEFATEQECFVRACYQDFKAKEFSKMILLDGIFIITLFVQNNQRIKKVAKEALTTLSHNSWMASDVKHDMLLVENQLPFFFIQGLLGILDPYIHTESILQNMLDYFKDVGSTSRLEKKSANIEGIAHLVHFLLVLHIPSTCDTESWQSIDNTSTFDSEPGQSGDDRYLLETEPVQSHKSGDNISPSATVPVQSHDDRFGCTKSTSELHQAGVCFCPLQSEELFAVSFDKDTGELRIPQFTVNDTTETFFRNLIAFEQCSYTKKYIASYVIFMDGLIDTAEDVKLLVKHGIIVNSLGENQLVADMFNNLHKEVIENVRDFYFAQICHDLNEYSKDFYHQLRSSCFKWKLILENDYFSNPWSAISFIAATIVVVLTIVQTVYAIRNK